MSSWDGNIAGITKGTFEVKTDSNSGLKFVTKTKDELTKIIEVTTKRKHPVLCLKTQGQDIAQFYPLKNISVNYTRLVTSYGKDLTMILTNRMLPGVVMCRWEKKTLGNFMTNISKKCRLSQVYTNHSRRVTGATILAKRMYANSQIMAVTGNKSVASLSLYQRVDKEDKIRMGQTLTDNVLSEPSKILALPQATAKQYSHTALPVYTKPAVELQSSETAYPIFKSRNQYTPALLPNDGPLPPTAFKLKHLLKTTGTDINEYLKGADMTQLFTEFREPAVNTRCPQIFNNCQVTIVNNITIQKP